MGGHALDALLRGRGQVIRSSGTQVGVLPVRALQQHLKDAGYDVKVDGKLGPITKSALRDYLQPGDAHSLSPALSTALRGGPVTGKRDPKHWNQRFGTASTRSVVNPAGTKGLDSQGNPTPPMAQLGAGKTKKRADTRQTLDLGGLQAIAANVGVDLPASLADQMAGLQYDAPIRDLGIERARQTVDAAQSLGDIKNWYGQVLDSQDTAAKRDKAINAASGASMKDMVASIVGSLGGAANEGSPMVAAAGANEAGTLGALGSIQEQYNSDLVPLLKAEQAGAASRQVARNAAAGQDISSRLIAAINQRGQAKAAAGMDISKYNSGLDQQRFQNQLALEQAREAALMTHLKVAALTSPAAKAAKPISASVLASASQNAYGMFPRDENNRVSVKGMKVPDIVRNVNNSFLQAGLDLYNPQVAQSAMATLRSLGIQPDPRWYTAPRR